MTVSLGFVKRKKCLKEGKKMTVSLRTSSNRICYKRQPTYIVPLFGCGCSLVKINFCYLFETDWIVNFLPCCIVNLSCVWSLFVNWVCLVKAGRLLETCYVFSMHVKLVALFCFRCHHGRSSGQDLSEAGFTFSFPSMEHLGGATELLYVYYPRCNPYLGRHAEVRSFA